MPLWQNEKPVRAPGLQRIRLLSGPELTNCGFCSENKQIERTCAACESSALRACRRCTQGPFRVDWPAPSPCLLKPRGGVPPRSRAKLQGQG